MSDQPTPHGAAKPPTGVPGTTGTRQTTNADDQSPPATAKKKWRHRLSWQIGLGICLTVAAVAHYLKTSYQPLPLASIGYEPEPIEVWPELPEVDSLPVEAGALAGCNLLLITLDATRADRLGCYGNEAIQTSTLDRLAREGVIFSQAAATAPTTVPSHSSIMTGLYPEHHGAYVNGLFRLTEDNRTLAETLGENGYTTGAVISAFVLDSRFGLGQGFDHFDDDLSDCEQPPMFLYKERKADRTTQRAVEWLRRSGEQPFFLWVHYFDPHAPYNPPSPYLEQCGANVYDGEISFTDAELGKLIDALDELGLTDRTLVVAVGDHGESLGQHNELTHAFLVYEPTLRVPLIMRCGRRLGGGVHVSRRVSQVDIVPTVQSLLGLDAPLRTDGVDLTREIPETRPVFSETRHGMLTFGWGVQLAVCDGADKLIYGPEPALFDIADDPHEKKNVIDSRPDRANELKRELEGLFGADLDMADVAQPTETLAMEDRQKLEAIGYLISDGAAIPPPEQRANPEDMMPAMHLVEQIMYTRDFLKEVEEKIRKLEALAEDFPNFHPGLRFLADLYRLNGQPEKAVESYAHCLEVCRDSTSLYGMALANLALERRDEATSYFQEIVTRYPDHLPARHFLGMLAGQSEEYNAAIEQFQYILDVDPDFVQAGMQPCAVQLLQAYTLAGRVDELPSILRPKLDADPRLAHVRGALAAYYAGQNEFAQAEALLREGWKLAPDDPGAVSCLALFLAGCPNPEFRKVYEGVALMEDLAERTGYQEPKVLCLLSRVYAMTGRLDAAIAVAEKARGIAVEEADVGLLEAAEQHLELFRTAKATGGVPGAPTLVGGE